MTPILDVVDIEKYYGNKGNLTKAVNHVSFQVEKGEFIGIMGPSGSGKTTLLNCISTIDTIDAGHIYLGSQDLASLPQQKSARFRQENLGFIFQDFNLLDTLSIEENIALPLSIQNMAALKIDAKIDEISGILGISDVIKKYPYQMSGGQKQRVAAARALITDPAMVLADEPTGALDSRSARSLLESMEGMNQNYDATILMVTHDAFAASFATRVIFLKDGKIFNEVRKGSDTRKEFFDKIMDVVTLMGGDLNDF